MEDSRKKLKPILAGLANSVKIEVASVVEAALLAKGAFVADILSQVD